MERTVQFFVTQKMVMMMMMILMMMMTTTTTTTIFTMKVKNTGLQDCLQCD
jgi:hypothetical protein